MDSVDWLIDWLDLIIKSLLGECLIDWLRFNFLLFSNFPIVFVAARWSSHIGLQTGEIDGGECCCEEATRWGRASERWVAHGECTYEAASGKDRAGTFRGMLSFSYSTNKIDLLVRRICKWHALTGVRCFFSGVEVPALKPSDFQIPVFPFHGGWCRVSNLNMWCLFWRFLLSFFVDLSTWLNWADLCGDEPAWLLLSGACLALLTISYRSSLKYKNSCIQNGLFNVCFRLEFWAVLKLSRNQVVRHHHRDLLNMLTR